MADEGSSLDAMVREIVDELVDEITADYRIDAAAARRLVEPDVAGNLKLRAAVAAAPSLEKLRRTRAFRDARKAAKRRVYQTLRQYKSAVGQPRPLAELVDELAAAGSAPARRQELTAARREELTAAILASHASTRERLADRAAFDAGLLATIGEPRTILDAGSGVYPLMFPFAAAGALERYVAAERDPLCVAAIAAYGAARPEPRLTAVRWDLEEGWEPIRAASGIDRFEVALLLKLVPVVERQQPHLLAALAATPAERLLVTGSRRSLTKQQSIERRERASLRRFAALAGRPVGAELAIGDELVMLLEERA